MIAALDADIVALQEVALLNVDGRLHDQATLLAPMTEMVVRFGAVRHFPIPDAHYAEPAIGSGLFGNAILTRLPLGSSRVIALPQAPAAAAIEPADSGHALAGVRYVDVDRPVREPRCALIIEVTLPDGRELSVASAHLSHIGSRERELQSIALVEGMAGPGPAVVLGDLNAPIEHPELTPLAAAFDDAFEQVGVPRGDERRLTMDERDARIDHILLREAVAVECRVAREAGDASDHWPVLATISA